MTINGPGCTAGGIRKIMASHETANKPKNDEDIVYKRQGPNRPNKQRMIQSSQLEFELATKENQPENVDIRLSYRDIFWPKNHKYGNAHTEHNIHVFINIIGE